MTDANDLFRLAEIEGKGKVLIATKDLLPGKVCLVDYPALIISNEEVDKLTDEVGALALLVAGYDVFKEIESFERRNVILSLFGTTCGMKADILRDFAKTCPFADDLEETELFVKVTSIVRLNAFDTGQFFAIVQYFNEKINALPCPGAGVLELIQRIECIPYPKRHWASVGLIEQLLYLKSVMSRDTGSSNVLHVAQEYRALYLHVACYPNETFVFAMYHMIFLLANIKFSPKQNHLMLNIFLASSCRMLLRTSMIIAGREYNTERIQEILCDQLLLITPRGVENDDPNKCSLCLEHMLRKYL
eukprot:gene15005-17203_t